MRIVNVVGARPNLIKVAPIIAEMCCFPDIEPVLVHTGQHYDDNMSKVPYPTLPFEACVDSRAATLAAMDSLAVSLPLVRDGTSWRVRVALPEAVQP